MSTKNCEECGNAFEVKWPKNPNRFCSYSCRSKFNAKTLPTFERVRVTATCVRCGKSREVTRSRATQNPRFYCSKACADSDKKLLTGPDHPLFKEKIPMTCKVCGKVVGVKPSLVGRFSACSKHCAAVWGHKLNPRISSIEVKFGDELIRRGETIRPQEILGRHIVDFYLPDRNLVIECDGTYWHSGPKVRQRDAIKDKELRALGIRVIRIPEAMIEESVHASVDHALTPLLM